MHFQFSRKKKNAKRAHSLLSAQNRQNAGSAHLSARARRPYPGRNLGLGRQSVATRSPAWAKRRSNQPAPLDQIRRPLVVLGQTKTATGAALLKPYLIRPSLFSLFASFFLLSAASTERRTESEQGDGATMAPSPAPSPARVLPNG